MTGVKARCPSCNGPVDPAPGNASHPFCSERCKLADLGQWFAGRYAIPADNPVEPPPEPKPQRQ